MSNADWLLAVCRSAHNAATMLLWGAYAYLASQVPRDLRSVVARHLNSLRIGAIAVAVGTSVVFLPIEVAAIGDGWSDVADWAAVKAVLCETSVGRAWQIQALAATVLALTLVMPVRLRLIATAAAAGLLLSTLVLTGHAVMHEGRLGVVQQSNDAVHVLAAGAWLGALVPLLPVLRALDDPSTHRSAAIALRRFSTVGHAIVVLVIGSGIANTLLILRRWPTDWSVPYQALLSAKILLAFAMAIIAVVNRYWFVPRTGRARKQACTAIYRGTAIEIGLGAAALVCVSVFGLLEPR